MTPDGGGGSQPACSVVIGARLGEHDVDRVLSALEPQIDRDIEVILVDDGSGNGPGGHPPWVRRYCRPGGLVPELWTEGLRQANGPVVALTAASVVPDKRWVSAVRRIGEMGCPAVGGAVEPGPDQALVDWAVYFCRYARYMLPFEEGGPPDIAADNAAYHTETLRRFEPLWQDAFLEPFVHQAMRQQGYELTVRPWLIVRHVGGESVGGFARQRFRHGREHGRRRAAENRRAAIVVTCLTAPAVPALMLVRAGRLVWSKRRHRLQFAVALPLLLWFYGWWAAGELAGGIDVIRGRGTR